MGILDAPYCLRFGSLAEVVLTWCCLMKVPVAWLRASADRRVESGAYR